MTATSQHGLHPDAESLSAFSEQALGKRERAEVLAHLAVCGRCRQVVALAREAADAGAETAAPTRKTVAPNAWWKHWRLVWVPAGVAVAFAVTTISFVIERTDRRGPDIKIAEQNPTSSTASPSTPPPTEQAKVEPPAAAAPAPPTAHTAKHARTEAAEQPPAPTPPAVTAQMPSEPGTSEPEPTDQVEARREAQQPHHEEAQQALPEYTTGAMRPAYSQPDSESYEARQEQAEHKQAEQQRQAEVDASRMRSFKHKAEPAAAHGANDAPPADATQTVTIAAAPPLETPAAEPAEPTPATATQLPSRLATVSIASRGHLLLAIDKAGTLFLSEDHGTTWERIATQWTGRAIAVRQRAQIHGALYAAPAVQNGPTDGSPANAGLAPSPTVFFELSNDKNQTWVSTDGRTWTAK